MNKNSIVSIALALITLIPSLGSAQVYYSGVSTVSTNCISIDSTFGLGSRGASVSTLQVFLANRNYPGSGSWMVTGFYGRSTASAVRSFQSEQGLSVSGIVDNATRTSIYNVSCGTVSSNNYNTNQGYNIQNGLSNNGYGYSTGYNNYNYNYGYNSNNAYSNGVNLNLTSLSRNTGSYGDTVTLYGTGFDTYGNTVYMGSVAITPSSSNGTSLTFTIPYNSNSGTVDLYVINSRGKSNSLSFAVSNYGYGQYNNGYYGNNYYGTSGCSYSNQFPGYYSTPCQNQYVNNTSAPISYSLSPNAGTVGTVVTINGSGFSTTGNTIHFGTGIISNVFSYDGRGLSFTVPSQLTGYGTQLVGLGTYSVSVTNALGYTTNSLSFNVTSLNAGGTTSNLNIYSVAPMYGSIGSVVTVTGNGFTPTNNTVRFGNGVVNGVSSYNGTILTFSVPSYLSPYCAANTLCPQYLQLVTAGSYPISITNSNGTSNPVTYIVQ